METKPLQKRKPGRPFSITDEAERRVSCSFSISVATLSKLAHLRNKYLKHGSDVIADLIDRDYRACIESSELHNITVVEKAIERMKDYEAADKVK